MTDLSDIDMTGVKPMSEAQELPIGQYLVRIEDTEKKQTKEKYDDAGDKMPPNHYLQVALQVYGGPNDGQTEFSRLNLWNTNDIAVRIAKSELKSIQDATGVHPTPDAGGIMRFKADWLHGKWMILEVKPTVKDPAKTYKHYSACSPDIIAAMAHVPPVPAKPPVAAATPAAAAPAVAGQAAAPATAAAAGGASALPSWAQKKPA